MPFISILSANFFLSLYSIKKIHVIFFFILAFRIFAFVVFVIAAKCLFVYKCFIIKEIIIPSNFVRFFFAYESAMIVNNCNYCHDCFNHCDD